MKIRQVRFILGFLILLLSFQNCGGSGAKVGADSKDSSSTGSTNQDSKSPASSNVGGSSGLNSGSARGISKSPSSAGGSSGGVSAGSAGSISSGGGSMGSGSGTSGSTCLGCTGTGGGGLSGGIGVGEMAFKITKQPISKSYPEGSEFFVGVSVEGGRGPFVFKWYRNSEEIAPRYGTEHYESYNDMMDRIYKEGEYYVTITDSKGSKLTSSRAMIRMDTALCGRGNYFISLSNNNSSGGFSYYNDMFYYKNSKYLVSQNNINIRQMQLNSFLGYISSIGFGYFTINQDISNNQNFVVDCGTDIPTIHTSVCATNATSKCYYNRDEGNGASQTYSGGINFTCRNGYIEFKSNTCTLTAPAVGTGSTAFEGPQQQ